jgi:molybdopterin molybdotransferase
MLSAWCSRFGLPYERWVVRDEERALTATLEEAVARCDALVTIGGTGGGAHDLVLEALEGLGGEILLEGVRLRPGRTSSFGTILGKPVFLLPGTPSANETAFLLLALPGLLRLMGAIDPPFPLVPARFSRELRRSREHKRWTQAVRVQLSPGTFFLVATPLVGRAVQERRGRLAAVASANGLLLMEEGEDGPRTGDIVGVILLSPFWGSP